jgi:hypothetical protein
MLVLGAFAYGTFNPLTPMPVSPHTIIILSRAAAEKIGEFPLPERIRIYHALGESLPRDTTRVAALELARIFSQAAALELEFQETVRATPEANDE